MSRRTSRGAQQHAERFPAVAGAAYRIPESPDHSADLRPDRRLVVDDQHQRAWVMARFSS